MFTRRINPFARPRLHWPPPDPALGYRDLDSSWGDRVGIAWGSLIGVALVGTWTVRRLSGWDPGVFEIIMGVVFTVVVGAVIGGVLSWLFIKAVWSRGYPRRYQSYREEYEQTNGHPGTEPWSAWYPAETRDEAAMRLGMHPLDIHDPWAHHRPPGWARALPPPQVAASEVDLIPARTATYDVLEIRRREEARRSRGWRRLVPRRLRR